MAKIEWPREREKSETPRGRRYFENHYEPSSRRSFSLRLVSLSFFSSLVREMDEEREKRRRENSRESQSGEHVEADAAESTRDEGKKEREREREGEKEKEEK